MRNPGLAIESPLTFDVSTGTTSSKIIDIKYNVIKPKNKILYLNHTIPRAKWIFPKEGVHGVASWEYDNIYNEHIGFNIYRSLLRDTGYGRVNAAPITTTNWEIVEKARKELYPSYYKLGVIGASGWESPLSEPIEVSNFAPIKSFTNIANEKLTEAELEFSKGKSIITIENGLDSGAELEIYLLCKVLPGSVFSPMISLRGSPSVRFNIKSDQKPIKVPPIQFIPTKVMSALTPVKVDSYATSKKIYLKWQRPTSTGFVGVRIFRTQERLLGDLSDINPEQEIYIGPGYTDNICLSPPNITSDISISEPLGTEGNLRFNGPKYSNKTNASNKSDNSVIKVRTPKAPTILRMYERIAIDNNYFVDATAKFGTSYTYIVYGIDKNRNMSYPVFINASLSNLSDECRPHTQ